MALCIHATNASGTNGGRDNMNTRTGMSYASRLSFWKCLRFNHRKTSDTNTNNIDLTSTIVIDTHQLQRGSTRVSPVNEEGEQMPRNAA